MFGGNYNLLTFLGNREKSKLLNWARFCDVGIFFLLCSKFLWGLSILGGGDILHSGIYKNIIEVHRCIENKIQVAVIVSARSLDYSSFHIIVAGYNGLVALESTVTISVWKKLPPMYSRLWLKKNISIYSCKIYKIWVQ